MTSVPTHRNMLLARTIEADVLTVGMRHPRDWMEVRPEGLYCKVGEFFIDPVRPVPAAVVTHGHSDHARAGHVKVVATPDTVAIMACRFGKGFAQKCVELPYARAIHCGDARVTLYPQGTFSARPRC